MTKKEKIAILIDWVKNLEESEMDNLIEHFFGYEGADVENFLDNQ